MRRLRVAVATIATLVGSSPGHPVTRPTASCRAHAPEAAVRSGLAIDVILRVMHAESGANSRVVSSKGAVGCMQIMPTTWTYLSQRYGLGGDPYDARMNVIGGALYLAELARRFGWPGAYAAYNAGPARYTRYANNAVPLPAETVSYVARLGGAAAPAIAAIPRARWQEARLFLDRASGVPESNGASATRLETALEGSGASQVSPAAPPIARIVSTLFPFSTNAAPVRP